MRKLTKIKFVFVSLLLLTNVIYAQNRQITGQVISGGDDSTLPGVTVYVKGTSTGAITDINGDYRINVTDQESILVFSFVGFLTQEISVGNQTSIDVILNEDVLNLEEVTVVGYGTKTKATVTGAIASVSQEELTTISAPNVATILSGRVSGVATVQLDGTPGADDPDIYIRGVGSLTNERSSPLVLVDGVERPFTQIDPSEIEDISVLKDASATAVFGVRGANGVLLITTRRGEVGKPKITLSSSFGLQQPTRMLETVGSADWFELNNQMMMNDGNDPLYSQELIDNFRSQEYPLLYPDIQQADYIVSKFAPITKLNLNISGGVEKAKYFISLGYMNQEGFFKQVSDLYDNTFNFKRFNYRANLDLELTPTTLAKINLGGIYGQKNDLNRGDAVWYTELLKSHPWGAAGFHDDGTFIQENEYYTIISANQTQIRDLWENGNAINYTNRLNFDIDVTQDLSAITKGLTFGIKGSYNTNYGTEKSWSLNREEYRPWKLGDLQGLSEDDPDFDETIVYEVTGTNSSLRYSDSYDGYDRDWYLEARLNYARSFGNHNVTGLVLYNRSKNYYPSEIRYIPKSYLGWVGRVTYDWKTRYMLELNVGYNGSENFAADRRFGLFPSASAAWVASEENFMQGAKSIISYLKLRASYGKVGSDNGVSRFMYIPGVWDADSGDYDFSLVPNPISAAKEGAAANPIVTWETATKMNFGFDMEIADKLSVNLDVFHDNREDILISRNTTPILIAFQLPNVNFGRVENRGYELSLAWRGGKRSGFSYRISPSISFARNKIIEMDEIQPVWDYQLETGGPTGRTLAMDFDRFFADDDFIIEQVDGNTTYTLKEGIPVPTMEVTPGDPMFVDTNKDGVINEFDMTWQGYGRRPEYVAGLNLDFNYKNLSLTANFRATTHATVSQSSDLLTNPFGAYGTTPLLQYMADNSWTPETAETATLPKLSITKHAYSNQPSSLYIWDASYIRLTNIQLSYTFRNAAFMEKLGLQGLQFYVNGTNIFTIDRLKYFDPETNALAHPLFKNYVVGLTANF